MSNGEVECISTAVAYMRASHLRMLIYDLICMGSDNYDQDNINMEPAGIIVDNEAVKSMVICNKDTAGNRHVARRHHHVRQGTALQEDKFQWIGSKIQLVDPLTKSGSATSFMDLWKCILYNCEE